MEATDAGGLAPPLASPGGEAPAEAVSLEERRFQGEEETLSLGGGAEQHKRVARVLGDLAKTARSFLLYDPRNNAIHNFLSDLLNDFESCLRDFGDIHVDVQPFEMWYDGQCIYLNRDRERSMSFRLYRDGVRALTFQVGFNWEEMAKLLEILSIRYTGVHQNEDDTVTLLWKANFRCLEIVAVEGYVPDDDEQPVPTTTAPSARSGGEGTTLPAEVDLPAPRLGAEEEPVWEELSAEALEELRREAGSGALPDECLQLIHHLRQLLADPSEALSLGEVGHIFQEVQGFLLSEEYLPALVEFTGVMEALGAEEPPGWDTGRRGLAQSIVKSSGDSAAVRRLLRSISAERAVASQELIHFLDKACADPLEAVTQVMSGDYSATVREVGRQLLVHYGAGNPLRLQLRFKGASGHLAVDLLRCIAITGGDQVAVFIAKQASHADSDVQECALELLDGITYNGAVGKALSATYRESEQAMRMKLLPILARTGDRRFVTLLEGVIDERGSRISPDEALAVGKVMGQLDQKAGAKRWMEALTPRGWFRKQLPGNLTQQVAAASALSEVEGDEIVDTLRAALKAAGPDATPWIGRCLMRQQKRFGGAGEAS